MSHIPEWKDIRERYEISLENLAGIDRERIRYRIECISNLIKETEMKEKELNHFK